MASTKSSPPTRITTATSTKHKICLQWATKLIPNASDSKAVFKATQERVDRHPSRKVVDVGPTMTMEELGVMAQDFFLAAAANIDTDGSNDNKSKPNDENTSPDNRPGETLQLSTGYPSFKILEWNNNHEMVRDCLDHMEKVECTLVADNGTVKRKEGATKSNQPKKR